MKSKGPTVGDMRDAGLLIYKKFPGTRIAIICQTQVTDSFVDFAFGGNIEGDERDLIMFLERAIKHFKESLASGN